MKLEIVKGAAGMKGNLYLFKKAKVKRGVKVMSDTTRNQVTTIEGIEWEDKTARSAGKAAVGAIGGGLLAGPIGLIAGAALGGKRKDVSTAVITFYGGTEVIVRMTGKQYGELESWLH